MSTETRSITVGGFTVDVVRKDIKNLHLGVYPPHGRVRVAAYSGDNEPLEWAAASGRFGSVQCSVNMADQYAVARGLAAAQQAGLGVIAKRPLANACWRRMPSRIRPWSRPPFSPATPISGAFSRRWVMPASTIWM